MRPTIVAGMLALALPAVADEVLLKGGGRVKGQVVERRADAVVLETGPGRVTVPMSRVERIVSAASDLAAYKERATRLSATDVQGWLELGFWAQGRELLTQAREAFEHVVLLAPGNGEAHLALGHVRQGSQWMTPEDSYRARGLVEFEGRWVTPDEHRILMEERMADAEARRARQESDARVREAEARARAAEADARRAEAEARQVQEGTSTGGIPYPWIFGGGGAILVGPDPLLPVVPDRPPPVVSPTPAPPPPPAPPRHPARDGRREKGHSTAKKVGESR